MTEQASASIPLPESLLTLTARIAERCRTDATDDLKKQWGQYFTSPSIAAFMAGLVAVPQGRRAVRILDPGAGTGILGVALAERLVEKGVRVHLLAVEAEPAASDHLEEVMRIAGRRLGESFSFEVRRADFLDLDAPTLGSISLEPARHSAAAPSPSPAPRWVATSAPSQRAFATSARKSKKLRALDKAIASRSVLT